MTIQDKEENPVQQDLELHSNVMEGLNKVSPLEIIEAQQTDPTIGQVM